MRVGMFILLVFCGTVSLAGTVEKTYHFGQYTLQSRGDFQTISFPDTRLTGFPGEPLLPWHEVVLALPPGEAAVSIEVTGEEETVIPGRFSIRPRQNVRPFSAGDSGGFVQNMLVYGRNEIYGSGRPAMLQTQYLDGYAFALSAFTPVRYNPAKGQLSWYRKVTVKIITQPDGRSREAMKQLSSSENEKTTARSFAQNPEMIFIYPEKDSPATAYQYLIITPTAFKNEFGPLTAMYSAKGITTKIVTVDSIINNVDGTDSCCRIRNFIIQQHSQYDIEYVLLAGSPPLVPYRKFFCQVYSGGGYYTDYTIPADLYFSGLDGNYDYDGDGIYGEVNDSVDLLPDVSVGRFPVTDTAGLHKMIHKSVYYQTNPVLGELSKVLLAGEWLYGNPLTYGGPYMNLLINDHTDNGYFTHGIQSATHSIEKLYDTASWSWSADLLLQKLNQGKPFIHHLGHASTTYMMRLNMPQIVNSTFPSVNGIIHNYEILYTQGCYCGSFDATGGCIAGKAVSIDNWLVADICNSRYGWFDEGTTEGPSEHLQREFVSAVYNDTVQEKHIGTAHRISKIKTAPWVDKQGEWEPGAQRWCHYCSNLLGDPALEIWTDEPAVFSAATWTGAVDSNWNNPANWSPAVVPTTLSNLTITGATHLPVINTVNASFAHDITIQGGGNLTINPGKSLIVYGTVTLEP